MTELGGEEDSGDSLGISHHGLRNSYAEQLPGAYPGQDGRKMRDSSNWQPDISSSAWNLITEIVDDCSANKIGQTQLTGLERTVMDFCAIQFILILI